MAALKKTSRRRKPHSDKCVQWSDGTYARRLSFYIPPELYLKVKARCAEMDQKISAAMVPVLCRWLGENPADYE